MHAGVSKELSCLAGLGAGRNKGRRVGLAASNPRACPECGGVEGGGRIEGSLQALARSLEHPVLEAPRDHDSAEVCRAGKQRAAQGLPGVWGVAGEDLARKKRLPLLPRCTPIPLASLSGNMGSEGTGRLLGCPGGSQGLLGICKFEAGVAGRADHVGCGSVHCRLRSFVITLWQITLPEL